ncbi:MAG: hypothetical protein ACOZDY_09545 [Pseudomonadota bacterium]
MLTKPLIAAVTAAALALGSAGAAFAKLPAPPPPTEEQKAAAAAKKAKDEEAKKKAAEAMNRAQERAVENYKRGKGMAAAPAEAAKK